MLTVFARCTREDRRADPRVRVGRRRDGCGSDAQVDAIDHAAADFGLAFQIIDDVLDVEGASVDLGKTAGKDAAAGKPTYPALYGIEASRRMAGECLDRAAAALSTVDLADSRLLQIGRWIVDRSN
jgi:geranylgeranyl pyrophosphate synthase